MYIVGNGKSGFGFRTGFWNGLWPRTEVPLHFFKGFITFRKPRTLPIPWQGRPGHHHSISDFVQTPGLCVTSGQFLTPKKFLTRKKNCARKGHFHVFGVIKIHQKPPTLKKSARPEILSYSNLQICSGKVKIWHLSRGGWKKNLKKFPPRPPIFKKISSFS